MEDKKDIKIDVKKVKKEEDKKKKNQRVTSEYITQFNLASPHPLIIHCLF